MTRGSGGPLTRRPPQAESRLQRGCAVSAITVLLTVTGHTVAGGVAPDVGLVVLLGLPLTAMMISLGDRQPGLGGVLLTLAAAQVGLHLLLSALGGHPHAGVGGGVPDATPQMVVVHLALTVVSAWLLRSADGGLAALGALLRRVLRLVLLRPARPTAVIGVVPVAASSATWLLDVLFGRIRLRRGPPVPA